MTTGRAASSTSASHQNRPQFRHRLSSRQSNRNSKDTSPRTSQERVPSLGRRRSSILSFSSLDDATHSFAGDVLNPGSGPARSASIDDLSEPTHWHSSPLIFAVLPAVGGLIFNNGSAFVTDVLLLGLAAVFLNWSVRLPWDWYYAAQAIRKDARPRKRTSRDIIPERLDEDDAALDTAGSSYEEVSATESEKDNITGAEDIQAREEAAAELRGRERLAFAATFIMPMIAAYGLHLLRSQLSRGPSTLVSDYNLTIFLLAALFRPVRQLVKLVSARTLHLQRVASGVDSQPAAQLPDELVADLNAKLAGLEAKVADYTAAPAGATVAQKAELSDLSAEVRKRYEPRLDGLERAVRRYEKRSTTMVMLTEQRLQNLESRLQDALSLAAVAAQSSQRRGVLSNVMGTATELVAWPFQMVCSIVVLPLRVPGKLYEKLCARWVGSTPQKSAKRSRANRAAGYREEYPKEKDGKQNGG